MARRFGSLVILAGLEEDLFRRQGQQPDPEESGIPAYDLEWRNATEISVVREVRSEQPHAPDGIVQRVQAAVKGVTVQ